MHEEADDAPNRGFVAVKRENIPITGPVLLQRANDFACLLNYSDFRPGGRWLQRFKEHRKIVYCTISGEAGAVNKDSMNKWLAGSPGHLQR